MGEVPMIPLGIEGEELDEGDRYLLVRKSPRLSVHNSNAGMRIYSKTRCINLNSPVDALTAKMLCLDILQSTHGEPNGKGSTDHD